MGAPILTPSTSPTSRRRTCSALLLIVIVALLSSACVPKDSVRSPASAPAPVARTRGLWLSPKEVQRLPVTGTAWERVRSAAGNLGPANIADQDSDHDVRTLAAALVYARTGDRSYRTTAATAILGAIGTERGGRTLALARNLVSYVIAADLIDLRSLNAGADRSFRLWLSSVRHQRLEGQTLLEVYLRRPNNWGTHAGASLAAVAAYLGERAELDRIATVFRGWLGDRAAYGGFRYADTSWQADPGRPVGVNPAGATKAGHSIDGALPEELRRGCSFQWAPCRTGYTWGALQGAVVNAQILSRQGYDTWNWQQRALLRTVRFHQRVDRTFGGWWAESDDAWIISLVNRAYGSTFPISAGGGEGKNMAFTDWTHG